MTATMPVEHVISLSTAYARALDELKAQLATATAEQVKAVATIADLETRLTEARAVILGHETQATISRWAINTFGPCSVDRAAMRAIEEMREFIEVHDAWTDEDPKAKYAKEGADVVVCLYRLFELLGVDLHDEVDRVMKINHGRRWVSDGQGCGYHVKVKSDAIDTTHLGIHRPGDEPCSTPGCTRYEGPGFTPRTEVSEVGPVAFAATSPYTKAEVVDTTQRVSNSALVVPTPSEVRDELRAGGLTEAHTDLVMGMLNLHVNPLADLAAALGKTPDELARDVAEVMEGPLEKLSDIDGMRGKLDENDQLKSLTLDGRTVHFDTPPTAGEIAEAIEQLGAPLWDNAAPVHDGTKNLQQQLATLRSELADWETWATTWSAQVPDEPANDEVHRAVAVARWKLATAAIELKKWRGEGVELRQLRTVRGLRAQIKGLDECLREASQREQKLREQLADMEAREACLRMAGTRLVDYECMPTVEGVRELQERIDGVRGEREILLTAISAELLPVLVNDGLSPDRDLEHLFRGDPQGAARVVRAAATLLRQYNTVRREDTAALSSCVDRIAELQTRERELRAGIRAVIGWRASDSIEGVRQEAARLREIHRALGELGQLLNLPTDWPSPTLDIVTVATAKLREAKRGSAMNATPTAPLLAAAGYHVATRRVVQNAAVWPAEDLPGQFRLAGDIAEDLWPGNRMGGFMRVLAHALEKGELSNDEAVDAALRAIHNLLWRDTFYAVGA